MILGAIFEIYYFVLVGDDQLVVTIAYCSVWILVNSIQLFILLKEKISLRFTERELILYKLSFSVLSKLSYRKLLDIAEWGTAEKDTLLIEEATKIDRLIFITKGIAKVESQNQVKAFISDGNFAGEMSFISNELTTATVTTITPMEYIVWQRDKLFELISKSKEIEEGLSTIFNHDLVKKLSKMKVKKLQLDEDIS
jgi:CRP-like cAMP-binding protein